MAYETWPYWQDRIKRLAREGFLSPLAKVDLSMHEHHLAGKLTRKAFSKTGRSNFPSELIHSDICGLANVRARLYR